LENEAEQVRKRLKNQQLKMLILNLLPNKKTMTVIIIAIVIFLELIIYLIIFDIILSWLTLAGINFRPKFIRDVLSPIYKLIRKYIPTRF
jgi:hypothetical protein